MRGPLSAQITYGALLTIALVLFGVVLLPVWRPLVLAAVLAGALGPLHEKVAARLGGRRTLTAILVIVAVVFLLLLPLAVILIVLIPQLIEGVGFLQRTLESGGLDALLRLLPAALRGLVEQGLAHLPSAGTVVGSGQKVLAATLGALAATGNVALLVVLMLIALYLLLVDGRDLVAWLERVLPLPDGQSRELLTQVRAVSVSVLGSTLASGAAQAVLAAIGFSIARVPYPLFFGVIVFFASFVPSVGSAIVMLPTAGIEAAFGHPFRALFLALWGLVVVGMIDNLIKPIFIRGRANLGGGPVFFALLGGVIVFGAMGLIVGPLSLTLLLGLIRIGNEPMTPKEPPEGAKEMET